MPRSTFTCWLTAFVLAYPALATAGISWNQCDPSVADDTSLLCGFLEVPLDYQDPTVGSARLAVAKANATGQRRGTVFFNPGGPGSSGITNLEAMKDTLLERTGGIYDVVSWDPRGVGLSTPGDTRCFANAEEYDAFFNGTIEITGIEYTGNFDDPADVQRLLSQAPRMQELYEELGQRCLNSSNGRFLRYMGTSATVRDMVSIADALDGPDSPINYFGISYGTMLGAWFINMFPERVGRVILDGVLDPVFIATQELSLAWPAHSYMDADRVYEGFITACALAGPEGCAIASEGDGPLQIDAKWQALLNTAYDLARANTSFPLTSGVIRSSYIFPSMLLPSFWESLANTWYPQLMEFLQGNSSQGLPAGPLDGAGTPPTEVYSVTAILCADSVDPNPLTNMTTIFNAVINAAQTTSHLFSAIWSFSRVGPCAFWPARSLERYQGPFNKPLANKILIASNTYDNDTPLSGAQRLTGLLGGDASLVELRSFGHTTLLNSPSCCITDIMSAYMVNGTLPANNTVCEVDEDFEVFPGVNTQAILASLPDTIDFSL
ncbi:alpha/beta-hydrolase [Earliella scabrosa]|nr:alpha/beta-hydrolase [Earliella scabrosa]